MRHGEQATRSRTWLRDHAGSTTGGGPRRTDGASRCGIAGLLAGFLLVGHAPALSGQEIASGQLASREVAASDSTASTASGARSLLRRADLVYAGVFFGSLALVKPLEGVDRGLHRLADENRSGADHLLYAAGDWAGDLWVDLGAAAVTFGVGELIGSSTVTRIGWRSLESLAAVDLLATLFKVGVGRQRPELTTESDVFRPIAWSHDFASFPSGHTAHAFALATTVSLELGGWTPWLAYPLATGVGASRVIGGRHWATDIVAGAALGIFTARLTDRLHRRSGGGRVEELGPRLTAVPLPGPGLQVGATLPIR